MAVMGGRGWKDLLEMEGKPEMGGWFCNGENGQFLKSLYRNSMLSSHLAKKLNPLKSLRFWFFDIYWH